MAQYIDKDALVAEIKGLEDELKASDSAAYVEAYFIGAEHTIKTISNVIDTLEAKEVNVWKTVDNINPPQADRNKIYCVLSKNKYILARVINHPHDELLQWKCTEFPHHRYDMCEGDKYMQIV